MTYYNTNNETGETLLKSLVKAESQEDCILSYFKDGGGTFRAPHELEFLFGGEAPITSIRRALTNLEKSGKLIKLDLMVMGTYGKMVHTWALASNQMELEL